MNSGLYTLNREMAQSNTCTLKTTATQPVFGSGNRHAKVVFIGEAPGKHEDLAGEPFVGAAGKMLDQLLESIDLLRSDVYITNVVKYRPPNNRDPHRDEVRACWPWLLEEIHLVTPDLIIPLGRHALTRFIPDGKISAMHGTSFACEIPELSRYKYYALYHPAAALYNGSLRSVLFEDFSRIPQILSSKTATR